MAITATGSVPELIAEHFPHGEEIQQALQLLCLRLSEGNEPGTKSTLVLIVQRDDGNAVMTAVENGQEAR